MIEKAASVAEFVLEHAEKHPTRDAIVLLRDERISYRELAEDIQTATGLIRGRGIGASARIGLWFAEGEWIDYAVGYFATQLAGAVAVVLPTDASASVVRRICRDLGITLVLSSEQRPLGLASVDEVHLGGGLRTLRPAEQTHVAAPESMGLASLADVVFTSGSTGTPKAVAASHRTLRRIAGNYRARPGGAAVVAHGLSHSTSIGTRQVLLTTLARGSTIVTCVPFDARRFLALVTAESARTAIVPAAVGRSLVRALESDPDLKPTALRTLRLISDQLPADVHLALSGLLPGVRVINAYGLTEGGDAHLVTTQEDCHLGPGGRPAPGTEVRIVSDSGDELPVGAVGFICLRDTTNSFSYLADPLATARTWRDGWTVTNDLGALDASGRVLFKGRAGGVARVGGKTVSVEQVRALLAAQPGVEAAAVVTLPHPTLGQCLAAVVEAPGETSVDGLKTALSALLPASAVPSPIVRVDALPLSRTGKPHQDAITSLVRGRLSASSRPCATPVERLVASLMRRVLELDTEPGAEADFFQLGGDSLSAVELLAELERELDTDVPMDLIFRASSLSELASELDRLKADR